MTMAGQPVTSRAGTGSEIRAGGVGNRDLSKGDRMITTVGSIAAKAQHEIAAKALHRFLIASSGLALLVAGAAQAQQAQADFTQAMRQRLAG